MAVCPPPLDFAPSNRIALRVRVGGIVLGYVAQISVFSGRSEADSEPESVVPNLDLASALSVGLRVLHTVPPGVAQIAPVNGVINFHNISMACEYVAGQMPVIFVQHLPENSRTARLNRSGLLLRDRGPSVSWNATEGGIPRSSRLGHSLKSLAFMRVCPKARSEPTAVI